MGHALDVEAVIVDSVNIALISQSLVDLGKRGNAVKTKCCLNVRVGLHNMLYRKLQIQRFLLYQKLVNITLCI